MWLRRAASRTWRIWQFFVQQKRDLWVSLSKGIVDDESANTGSGQAHEGKIHWELLCKYNPPLLWDVPKLSANLRSTIYACPGLIHSFLGTLLLVVRSSWTSGLTWYSHANVMFSMYFQKKFLVIASDSLWGGGWWLDEAQFCRKGLGEQAAGHGPAVCPCSKGSSQYPGLH